MKPLRILIVEDEPLIAMDLQDTLEDAGHQVVGIASSMNRALDLAERFGPLDLAIMDIDLAGGPDGIETAMHLRQRHDVPSLFLSGRLDVENRARAAEWSPVGFVSKPFQADHIVRVIKSVG